jgi:formylglycine-generating enzyme required for sulfatase activity
MVLVPGATLDGTLTPAGHGPGDKKGGDKDKKGKGGCEEDCDDGGSSSGDGSGSDSGTDLPPPPPPGDSSGSSSGSSGAAAPLVVEPFWLDAREVSASDYAACVSAGACAAPACPAPGADHPVACVTRDEAAEYCAWRGKRLPADEEWTAAAAGAAGRPFPWGVEAPSEERLDACGAECSSEGMYSASDGFPTTAPCGAFPLGATPEGALDLAGNVAEWVRGASPVVRGGAYEDTDAAAVASRAARPVPDGFEGPSVGFRCAADL